MNVDRERDVRALTYEPSSTSFIFLLQSSILNHDLGKQR
jgi:hypothetical protein